MYVMKHVRTVIAVSLSLLAGHALADDTVTFTPAELKWKSTAAVPGREQVDLLGDAKQTGPYVMRVKLAPNYALESHSHPEDRTYTILAGTWYIGWGEKFDATKLIPLPVGSFYIEPGNRPHFVATKADGATIQISGTGPSGQNFTDPAHAPKK